MSSNNNVAKGGTLPYHHRPTDASVRLSWLARHRVRYFCGLFLLSLLVCASVLRRLSPSDIIRCSWVPAACQTPSASPPLDLAPPSKSREAYVTFLSSAYWSGYVDSVRLLNFALKYDNLTRDPFERDVIVMTTEFTAPEVEQHLREEGAIVRRVPSILDLPGASTDEGDRYKDQYTKLNVWRFTEYERVLYVDGDILLVDPIHAVWDDDNAHPASGLAALSDPLADEHESPIPDGPYMNAGFMLIKPSEERFEDLIKVYDFDPTWRDQALINKFYDREGEHPWAPLDHIYSSIHAHKQDLDAGVHSELTELWRERFGRMEGYYLHKRIAEG